MKHLLTILITLFAINANAQTVSFSPTSVPLWGKTPHTAKLSVEYKDFELIGLFPYQRYYHYMPTTGEYKGYSNAFNVGLFYKPVSVSTGKFSARGGVGAFLQEFPTPQGSIVNFSLEIEYRISELISVEAEHLSNGFGIQNPFNPGVDHLSIKITI